jgi:hypothetical protein
MTENINHFDYEKVTEIYWSSLPDSRIDASGM